MKHVLWLLAAMAVSQVAGCATFSPHTQNPTDRIEAWLHQREYGKALAFLAEAKASPGPLMGDLDAMHQRIKTHIANHEQQVVAEADKAMAAQDWVAAFDLYKDALDRLPDSRRLQEGHHILRQRHTEHLEALELERLIAKGEWTLKDLEASRVAEAEHSGNWFARYSLDRKTSDAHALAVELAKHGKRALESNDLMLAQRILPLTQLLSNSPETRALNTRLQEALNEEALRIVTARARVLSEPAPVAGALPMPPSTPSKPPRESEELPKHEERASAQKRTNRSMEEFRKACQEKDLAEAQRLKSQLEKQGVNTPEFDTLSAQLAVDVAKRVKQLIDLGATQYSQQRYQAAKDSWKQAQALDPENEQLTARLTRVTRVLNKLQALRRKNAAAP
jgi:tetratricopeptide (TPR) repeat protein